MQAAAPLISPHRPGHGTPMPSSRYSSAPAPAGEAVHTAKLIMGSCSRRGGARTAWALIAVLARCCCGNRQHHPTGGQRRAGPPNRVLARRRPPNSLVGRATSGSVHPHRAGLMRRGTAFLAGGVALDMDPGLHLTPARNLRHKQLPQQGGCHHLGHTATRMMVKQPPPQLLRSKSAAIDGFVAFLVR